MLSDTENRIHYECDGSTNSFPITFPYNDDSEIKVYLYNTVTMEDETLITSYNIVDNNVVTNETYGSDYRLTIVRELPLTQDTNLSSSGILPPEVIEERFDKLTMQIQQLQDQLDRTLIMHKSTTYSGLHLPEPENGFFLLWKDGDLINSQYLSSDAASITPYTKTLLDDDNASEALSTLGVSDYIKTLLDDIDAETARQTLGTDIYATIDFMNASLAAATLNLFFTDTASSEVSGYYEMLFTETGESSSSLTINSVLDGDFLWSFISPEFDVADQLSAGLYVVSLWAEQDSNKTVTLTAKLYKRDSGGTETLLLETSTSDEIPKDMKTQIIMSGFLENDEAISSTDRVVLKIYANISGGGGAPNITIYMEGTDDSRIAVRIPTSVITSKIFDADGDTYVIVEETADEDVIHFYIAGSERVTINNDSENVLDICPDTDIYIRLGRTWIGHWGGSGDYAGFGHIDQRHYTSYALLQDTDGKTYLNAAENRSIDFRINNVTKAKLDSDGHLLVGKTSGNYKLDVEASMRLTNAPTTTAGANAIIAVNPAGVFYRSTSSIRYKENLRKPESGWEDKILLLKPTLYYSKTDKRDFYGLIVEDLIGVLDCAIMYNENNKPESIDWNIITTLLVASEQYSRRKIMKLEDKLNNLQEQINDIRQSATKESIN